MDTGPSGQDETQMKLFGENGCDWAIRGIFNKKRKASFDLFHFKLGWTIRDCEWEVADAAADTTRRERWKKEIKDKVTPLTYQSTGYQDHYRNYEYPLGNSPESRGFTIEAKCRLCQEGIMLKPAQVGRQIECPYCKKSAVALLTSPRKPRTHRSDKLLVEGPGFRGTGYQDPHGVGGRQYHDDPKLGGFEKPPVSDNVTEHSVLEDDERWYRNYRPRRETGRVMGALDVASAGGANDNPSLDEILRKHNDMITKKHGGATKPANLPAPVSVQGQEPVEKTTIVWPGETTKKPTTPGVSDK